jgi:hypothetical protein
MIWKWQRNQRDTMELVLKTQARELKICCNVHTLNIPYLHFLFAIEFDSSKYLSGTTADDGEEVPNQGQLDQIQLEFGRYLFIFLLNSGILKVLK